MHDPELTPLFERLRRHGDAEALGTIFDRTAPEILDVARRLGRDGADAEDVLQETFLTAIDRAWSFDARMPLEPWLVGIATVVARRQRRAETRAVDGSRVRGEALPPASVEAEAREVELAVRGAMERVPEMYREVVALHLEDGEKPAEIAAKLARRPGTVRVQLHRGLAMLRKALPAGIALGAAATRVEAEELASVRARVVGRASERASELVAHATRGVATTTGVAWIVSAVAGVAALATVASSWLARTDPATTSGVLASRANEVELARDGARAERTSVTSLDSSSNARSAAATSAHVLRVHLPGLDPKLGDRLDLVVRSDTGERVLHPSGVEARDPLELDVSELWKDGATAPGLVLVRVDHPPYMPAQASIVPLASPLLAPDAPIEVWIPLVRARGVVTGVVTVADGAAGAADRATTSSKQGVTILTGNELVAAAAPAAIELALFALDARGEPIEPAMETTHVTPGGRYRLRTSALGPHALVAVERDRRPATRRLVIAGDPAPIELDPIALDRGASIDARVEGSNHAPVADAFLYFTPVSIVDGYDVRPASIDVGGLALHWLDAGFEHATRNAKSDAKGALRVEGLAPIAYRARMQQPQIDPRSVSHAMIEIADHGNAGVVEAPCDDAVFRPWLVHALVEVRMGSVPVAGAHVSPPSADGAAFLRSAASGADGRVDLAIQTTAPFRVRCSRSGARAKVVELDAKTMNDGDVVPVELEAGDAWPVLRFTSKEHELDGASVFVTDLVGLGDEALERVRSNVYRDREPFIMGAAIAADGTIARPIEPGRYWVHLRIAGTRRADSSDDRVDASFELELAGNEQRTIPIAFERGGRATIVPRGFERPNELATCVVRDERGALASVRFDRAELDEGLRVVRKSARELSLHSASTSELLRPGRYTLTCSSDGLDAVSTSFTIEAGKTTRVELAPPRE